MRREIQSGAKKDERAALSKKRLEDRHSIQTLTGE